MKLISSTREVPLSISKDILISAIGVQLQALGTLRNINLMDIVDIKFEEDTKDQVTLKFVLKEEVDVIKF